MLTELDLTEALRVCYDPELQINIVDLGRIHTVRIQPDTEAAGPTPRVHVTVVLLPRHEEQDAMLAAIVANRLLGIREISRVTVTLLDALPWTPDRMSPSARLDRSKHQGLIQLGDVL